MPSGKGRSALRILRHEAPKFVVQGADARGLSFSAFGRSFALELENNERVSVSAAARRAGVKALRGTLRGGGTQAGSWVRLTQTPAGPYGLMFDGLELYAIEPAAEVEGRLDTPRRSNLRPTDPVIYRLADAQLPADAQSCATPSLIVSLPGRSPPPAAGTTSALEAFQGLQQELAVTAALVAPTKQISIGVVGDHEFSQLALPNALTPEASLVARMNIVDGIFSSQLGVKINATISVFVTSADPFTATTAGSALLDEVGAWRLATASQSALGLTHLVTGRDLEGTNVGLGFVGTLCRARSGTSLSQGTLGTVNSALVIAHELGHNFGAFHDGEAGRACETVAPTFLMAPRLNSSDQFSVCSLTTMQPVVNAATACVLPLSTAPDADLDLPLPARRSRGNVADYSFDVRSIGGAAVDGIAVRVVAPAGLGLNSATVVGTPATPCTLGSDGTAQCAVGRLAADERRTITLNLTALQPGTQVLSVELTAANDGNASNDRANTTFRVDTAGDLSVTASASSLRFRAGTTTQYTAIARHVSGDAISDARLAFLVPSLLTVTAVAPNEMGCALVSGLVSCTPTALPVGAARPVTLTLLGARPGTASVNATITSVTLVDSASSNNSAIVSLTVDAVADLGVSIAAAPTTLTAGGTAELTATVTNISGDAVPDALLSWTLPAGLSVSAVGSNALGCSLQGSGIGCAPRSLAPGASATVSATVSSSTAGSYAIGINVRSASVEDPASTNNAAQASLTVNAPAPAQQTGGGAGAAAGGGGGGGGGAIAPGPTGLAALSALWLWSRRRRRHATR